MEKKNENFFPITGTSLMIWRLAIDQNYNQGGKNETALKFSQN